MEVDKLKTSIVSFQNILKIPLKKQIEKEFNKRFAEFQQRRSRMRLVSIFVWALFLLSCQGCGLKERSKIEFQQNFAKAMQQYNEQTYQKHVKLLEHVKRSIVYIQITAINPESDAGIPEEYSSGTGAVISEDGIIITAAHVIDVSDLISPIISVEFENGKWEIAKVLYTSKIIDTAILSVNTKTPDYLKFETEKKIKEGDKVFYVGNFLGDIKRTVVYGSVASLDSNNYFPPQLKHPQSFEEVIISDITVLPGCSGGPLLNEDGNILGITSTLIGNRIPVVGILIPYHFSVSVHKNYILKFIKKDVLDIQKKK